MVTGGAGIWLTPNSVNANGLSNTTLPRSLNTSTAPGLKPKVLFSPGPINKTLLSPSSSTIVWNSVPLVPIVPAGVLTTKSSGLPWLILPLKTLTLPEVMFVRIFPFSVLGSYTNSSIVIDDFCPSVKTVSSNNNTCDFDWSSTIISSPKYTGSPAFKIWSFWFLTVPTTKPIFPMIISLALANMLKLVINIIKLINFFKIQSFWLNRIYTILFYNQS